MGTLGCPTASCLRFLAVGLDKEVAEVGVLLVNGVTVHVLPWSLNRGTYPKLREHGVSGKLVGLSIVLYNEQGIAFALNRIGEVESKSCSFIPVGNLLAVEASLAMASSVELPLVMSLSFGGMEFVIRVLSRSLENWWCRPSQEKLGHPWSQAEVEDSKGAHNVQNSSDPLKIEAVG